MLDFYKISDDENSPDYPNEENFIGQLSFEDFQLIESVVEYAEKLNVRLNYFEDFRITFEHAIKILKFTENKIKTANKEKKACQRFIDILNEAVSFESGVVSFCD